MIPLRFKCHSLSDDGQMGIGEYRRRERALELWYKRHCLDDRARALLVPSRETGRSIQCGVFTPLSSGLLKGVLLHMHGECWAVSGNDYQDPFLAHVADTNNLVTVSVGYRLTPEFPLPKGPEDCFNVAAWLVANSKSHFGAEFCFNKVREDTTALHGPVVM